MIDPELVNLMVDGSSESLNLYEVYHHEDSNDRMRPLSYPQTDVFLVCFSVTRTECFENTKQMWVPEVRRQRFSYSANVLIIIIYLSNEV